MDNVITVSDVNFYYPNNNYIIANSDYILQNISLTLPRGKIIAIMGSSGSGKTTLLQLISGQNKLQFGSINILNNELCDITSKKLNELRKKIGMLFQFGALFTDMTVYDNLAFALTHHTNLSNAFIDKIIAIKLHAVGLFGTQKLYPQQLSGGMARRVALARALILDPQIMLYDEPFTGLDPISLNNIASVIKNLNDTLNLSSIIVTHDIKTSLQIADYIYFMANGKIVASCDTKDKNIEANPNIAAFLNGDSNKIFEFAYKTNINYNKYLKNIIH